MQHRVTLAPGADMAGFRTAARRLIATEAAPDDIVWTIGTERDLFGSVAAEASGSADRMMLPRAVAELVATVVRHRDLERYALLYAAIWRIRHQERALLEMASDPLVHRLQRMAKAVDRDLHRMQAFVRFRRVAPADGGERFVAWFEPEHFILQTAAEFFVERFGSLAWSILTPIGTLHWDRATLTEGPPAPRAAAPDADPFEAGWQAYYASTFNPARSNPALMRAEMPKKYWRNLPETQAIKNLIRTADVRVRDIIASEAAPPRRRDPAKAVAAMLRQRRP
jgi:probable DNA metabolism protein